MSLGERTEGTSPPAGATPGHAVADPPPAHDGPDDPSVPLWPFLVCAVVGVGLRFWGLGDGALGVDETFSTVSSRKPYLSIWGYIQSVDRHPPLSYLVLSPVVHLTHSTYAARVPSVACATLALLIFVWWQRRSGLAGLVACALFAVSPFLLPYAREARMFGLVTLGAVIVAAASDRWLDTGETKWAVAVAIGGLIASLSYGPGIVLACAAGLVPGWRRDRQAWIFRVVAGVGVVVWAALCLAASLRWSGYPSGYPPFTVSWVVTMLSYTVAPVPANRWIVVGLLAIGLVLVLRRPGPLRQLTLALFLAPLAAMVVLSLRTEVLIPKTLLLLGWVTPVLLGQTVAWAWRYRPLAAGVVLAVIVYVTVPYIGASLPVGEGTGAMLSALDHVRRPGDAVAINPRPLESVFQWYEGVVPGKPLVVDNRAVDGLGILHVVGQAPTNRVWLIESEARAWKVKLPHDWRPCGARRHVGGGYSMQCVEVGAAP